MPLWGYIRYYYGSHFNCQVKNSIYDYKILNKYINLATTKYLSSEILRKESEKKHRFMDKLDDDTHISIKCGLGTE